MAAYVITQTFVPDVEKIKKYIELAPLSVKKYGGIYLIRGGEMELFEGVWDVPRLAMAQFESMDAARHWYNSPEYTEAKSHRQGLAEYKMLAVDGVKEQPW